MRQLFFLLLGLFFVFFPSVTFAQTADFATSQDPLYSPEGWEIQNFHADIKIEPDGNVLVQETISVDFHALLKHGIYRDIPYVYENDDGSKTYTEIKVVGIDQDGERAEYKVTRNENAVSIRIGDPDKTISGVHTYLISYTTAGVLRSFADYDELYWNVTGNYWPVPIYASSAKVTLPRDGIIKIACFEGTFGSKGVDCLTQKVSAQVAEVHSSRGYDVGGGLTVVVGYTKGMVPILHVERPKSFFERLFSPPSLLIFFVATILGVGFVISAWWRNGRDYWKRGKHLFDPAAQEEVKPFGKKQAIVVEYEPPEKLRPAELGVLVDERADTLDVTATIIDLATRGFLSITEIPKKWMFGSMDYKLHKKNKDAKGLLPYEKLLLDELFDDKTEVLLSELKNKFYSDLRKVKEQLYKDVQDKKLFVSNPETIRAKYAGVGIVLLIIGVFASFITGGNELVYLFDVSLSLAVTGFFLLLFSKFMPRRSAYGEEMYRRVKGYHMFISRVEKYRQKFFEKQNMFNEILPYAIVLGLTDKFAKAMKDMGVKAAQPGWYVGYGYFNYATFGKSIDTFSSSLSSAIVSTPKSSGGFSSGGSSGGGFSGGGGGSW